MNAVSEKRFGLAVIALCLLLNLCLSSVGWHHSLREVHEFRQVQTALTAKYLARDGWQGLAYPLPLFGPPWSAPFEFPFYQAAVAALSRTSGWPLAESGRMVSLAFLLLSLPALHGLQEFLGISRERRWLLPCLTLLTPAYTYYSRCFLIESTALCASAWYLLGHCRAHERKSWTWPLLATSAGMAAALAKSTTFAVFLSAAALFSLVHLWRRWRQPDARPGLRRQAIAIGAWTLPPVVAGLLWGQFGDSIKAANPLTQPLVSGELRLFMLGSWSQRLDPDFWLTILQHARSAVLAPANAVLLVVFGFILAHGRRLIVLALLLCFLSGPLLLANVYAVHDYYLYATGVFALAALALACSNVLDLEAFPAGLRRCVVALILSLQLGAYLTSYFVVQKNPTMPVPELAEILRTGTGPEDVVLFFGQDWDPIVPYYADRRAIMVTDRVLNDSWRWEQTIRRLPPGKITALVVRGSLRESADFAATLARMLGLQAKPALVSADTHLYFSRTIYSEAMTRIGELPLREFTLTDDSSEVAGVTRRHYRVAQLVDTRITSMMHPAPREILHPFGLAAHEIEGRIVADAHAPTDLIFDLPEGRRQVEIEFGILAGAWQGDQKTDGVEFRAELVTPDNRRRLLFTRELQPVEQNSDRGTQHALIHLPADAQGRLILRTLPGSRGTLTCDWAYWAKVELR